MRILLKIKKIISANFMAALVIGVIIVASSSWAIAGSLKNKEQQPEGPEQTESTNILPASTFTPSSTPLPSTISSPKALPKPSTTPKPTQTPAQTPTPTPNATSNPTPTNNPTPTPQSNSPETNSPVITGISASNNNFGQYINYTVTGNNFGSSQGTATVFENGNSVSNVNITGWQNTSIQVSIVGPAETAYSLEITTTDGKKSNRISFTQPLGQPYFTPDSISPKAAKPGETITISGDRFDSGNGKVTFDGAEGTISSWSNIEIKVTLPNSIPAGKEVAVVVISSKGQQSSIHYYTLGN